MARQPAPISQQSAFETEFKGPLSGKEKVANLSELFALNYKWAGMKSRVDKNAEDGVNSGKTYELKDETDCDLTLGEWGTILEHWEPLGAGGGTENDLSAYATIAYVDSKTLAQGAAWEAVKFFPENSLMYYGEATLRIRQSHTTGSDFIQDYRNNPGNYLLVSRPNEIDLSFIVSGGTDTNYYNNYVQIDNFYETYTTLIDQDYNEVIFKINDSLCFEYQSSRFLITVKRGVHAKLVFPTGLFIGEIPDPNKIYYSETEDVKLDLRLHYRYWGHVSGETNNGYRFVISNNQFGGTGAATDLSGYLTEAQSDARYLSKTALEGNALVTTFAELAQKMASGQLSEGNWYRFKYQTVHILQETDNLKLNVNGFVYENKADWPNRNSVGEDVELPEGFEELVVFATTKFTIAPVAYSRQFPNDVIEYDPHNVWCTDTVFNPDGSVSVPGTRRPGFIIKRTDTFLNNVTPYDFRTVISIRYALNPPEWIDQAYGRWSIVKTGNDIWLAHKAAPIGAAPAAKSDYWVKIWEFKAGILSRHISPYKNSFLFGLRGCPVDNNSYRYFKTWNKLTSGTDEIAEDYYVPNKVNNNLIEPWRGGLNSDTMKQGLNNIIFCSPFGQEQNFSGGFLAGNCRYMTFGHQFANNNIASDALNITANASFIENNFGAYFRDCSFFGKCEQVEATSNFRQSTFGEFTLNYAAHYFTNNHLSGQVMRNEFNKAYFRDNVILGDFRDVSVNGVATVNTFIGNVLSMTFNQWFNGNILRGNWNDFVINMYINGRTLVNNHEIHPIQYRTPLGKLVYAIVDETMSIETKELT